jgi:hypothetical protein
MTSRHLISLAVAGQNRAFMVTGAPCQAAAMAFVLGQVAPAVALDLTRGPSRPLHRHGPAYGRAEPVQWVDADPPPASGVRVNPLADRAKDVARAVQALVGRQRARERLECGIEITPMPASIGRVLQADRGPPAARTGGRSRR